MPEAAALKLTYLPPGEALPGPSNRRDQQPDREREQSYCEE